MNSLFNASANFVAVIHIGYFLFVLGGTIAVIVGFRNGWAWARNAWFRFGHMAAIYIVLFEEVTGIPCALNLIQAWLRTDSIGQEQATEGVGGVLDFLLYQTIPPLALDIFYWAMGIVVTLLLWKVPVRWRWKVAERGHSEDRNGAV